MSHSLVFFVLSTFLIICIQQRFCVMMEPTKRWILALNNLDSGIRASLSLASPSDVGHIYVSNNKVLTIDLDSDQKLRSKSVVYQYNMNS